MIRIVFIVEGQTEMMFFQSDKFKQIVSCKNPQIDLSYSEQYSIQVITCKGTIKHSSFQNLISAYSKSYDIVIPVFDACDKHFNLRSNPMNKLEHYNEFCNYLSNCFIDRTARVISYMSFQELETLLFSNINKVNDYIATLSKNNSKIKHDYEMITDIEKEIEHPSDIINSCLVQYYNKPVFFNESIQNIPVDTILKKCEFFNLFIDKFTSCINDIKSNNKNYSNPIKII